MNEQTREGRLLTVPEAAERLGLHPMSVYRKLYAGELPAIRLGGPGAALRIDSVELEQWIEERRLHRGGDA